MSSKKDNITDMKLKIMDAALNLAIAQGWDQITLRDIAEKAGVTIFDLHNIFEDKSDILAFFARRIDQKVLSSIGEYNNESTPRDRLFDILMERFEALNEYREGISAVVESFKYDPKQALISMPYICKSMLWMLEAAGIETNGVKGTIKVVGLTYAYIKLLRVWKEDISHDLSKTMAALDKSLDRIEKVANTIGL